MALELGRVNTEDLIQNNYKIIGISINKRSSTNGIFAPNFTTIDQAKANLINLIMTKKGERLMQPEFGCDIWKILFDQIIDGDIQYDVENAINEAVKSWLPNILITSVEVNSSDELKDGNQIQVSIGFAMAINPKISDSIDITLQ